MIVHMFRVFFTGAFRKPRETNWTEIIPRLYIIHVLILPGLILALIAVHLGLVRYQKHTQFPGPGRTEHNVVGVRIMPQFAAKGGAFFAVVAGVLALASGLLQINPIWHLGPYDASQVSAGSQPVHRRPRAAQPAAAPP